MKLVIFDVDGTLVDSQADIVAAMSLAFEAEGQVAPKLSDILGIVGLSLDVAIPMLAPDADEPAHARMVQGYKDAYMSLRAETGAAQSSPLYTGALECLHRLHAREDVILGVATGKSKRGLDKLIEAHDLQGFFMTQQVADHHPSKPHPSMIYTAMSDAGTSPSDTVMIGDTSFDMDMAAAAGVGAIGVTWGYHAPDRLTSAHHIIDSFDAIEGAMRKLWEHAT